MIRTKSLCKSFGDPPLQVLFDLNIEIPDGSFTSVTGRSGSGKSTLLYCISTLDTPTTGEVFFDDRSLSQMTPDELHYFRNQEMGFIFQFHYLLPELTALENVLMPSRKTNTQQKRLERAKFLLHQFGLDSKFGRLPRELSGGEQQRVAIARALIMEPKYIFADEPTGNLDSVNGALVMEILKKITVDNKTSVIYVTHDLEFAKLASHTIQLVDGHIL